MRLPQRTSIAFGVLAALLWSPHFQLFSKLRAEAASPLVLSFYFLLGGAGGLLLLLLLSGRIDELDAFKRRETYFILLAAFGGYGFWVLRSLSPGAAPGARAHLLFYAAPLAAGVLSFFTAERADGRAFFGLVLGFVGCIMMVPSGAQEFAGLRGLLLGIAAAVCWGIFWLLARPIVREEKSLPVAALVTGIGAACLLVTCISTGAGIFEVRPGQLAAALVGGAVTVGFMMALWLRCLAGMAAPLAAGLWYLALLFSGLWALLGFGGARPDLWWLLGGGLLVLLGLHSALTGRRRRGVTMSDVIRGG